MVLVKMTQHIAGTPSYHAGQEVELDDRIAAAWIKEGYCAPVRHAPVEKATK